MPAQKEQLSLALEERNAELNRLRTRYEHRPVPYYNIVREIF